VRDAGARASRALVELELAALRAAEALALRRVSQRWTPKSARTIEGARARRA